MLGHIGTWPIFLIIKGFSTGKGEVKDTSILISDFCLLDGNSEQYRLSKFERLTLVGGDELEKALSWVSSQFTKLHEGRDLGKLYIKQLTSAHQFYVREEWQKNPASFFVEPTSLPQVKETALHGLSDGEVIDLEFESSYKVQNPAAKREFTKYKNNRNVRARMWRHRGGARGTIIAVHGWSMGDQRINALAFKPGYFYGLGLDVCLIELPFHGRRSENVSFPGTSLPRTNEAIAQAISDLRELKRYLEVKGSRNVGCIGISLGGYIAALWASLDALTFCVPIVPMVCMGEVAWEFISKSPKLLQRVKDAGFTAEHFKQSYSLHSPLSHRPKVPTQNRMIVAGLGDEIVSPRHPHQLWMHWDEPKIHWFAGGHMAQFKESRAFSELADFIARIGI